MVGLVCHNPDRLSLYAAEPDHDIGGEKRLDFKEGSVVNEPVDDGGDIVGDRRAIGDNVVQFSVAVGDF